MDRSPFDTIDKPGVGWLVRLAAWTGREAKPDLGLGICGEHGGDPDSIHFFHMAGLDYVSCSPFRVPIARVAAAQAAIAHDGWSRTPSPRTGPCLHWAGNPRRACSSRWAPSASTTCATCSRTAGTRAVSSRCRVTATWPRRAADRRIAGACRRGVRLEAGRCAHARGRRGRRASRIRRGGMWAFAGALLVRVFCTQEWIEGQLAEGHAAGWRRRSATAAGWRCPAGARASASHRPRFCAGPRGHRRWPPPATARASLVRSPRRASASVPAARLGSVGGRPRSGALARAACPARRTRRVRRVLLEPDETEVAT